MATLAVGDIVSLRFPYSDLTKDKIRPGLIVGFAEFGDFIVCQITSNSYSSQVAIKISPQQAKGMITDSYIRPDKIFTADKSLVVQQIASLSKPKAIEVKRALKTILGI